jgi:hypothetical protein
LCSPHISRYMNTRVEESGCILQTTFEYGSQNDFPPPPLHRVLAPSR